MNNRDPYLYEGTDVLRNIDDIMDSSELRRHEAKLTNCGMHSVYRQEYQKFDAETLCNIHFTIFGHLYEWAGQYRTIQMAKPEDVLGGDTVRYAHPSEIKKQLSEIMKEVKKVKRTGKNDKDVVFRMVRITSAIWHIHPFREGNTRATIAFAVMWAKFLGFDVDHELFKQNAQYVRNALVWCTQGIYSNYEYLENIFYDAILHESPVQEETEPTSNSKYQKVGDYEVKNYVERPHEYKEE